MFNITAPDGGTVHTALQSSLENAQLPVFEGEAVEIEDDNVTPLPLDAARLFSVE